MSILSKFLGSYFNSGFVLVLLSCLILFCPDFLKNNNKETRRIKQNALFYHQFIEIWIVLDFMAGGILGIVTVKTPSTHDADMPSTLASPSSVNFLKNLGILFLSIRRYLQPSSFDCVVFRPASLAFYHQHLLLFHIYMKKINPPCY